MADHGGFEDGTIKPWEGSALCDDIAGNGHPCQGREIEGLGKCFFHVPEDDLEEAEDITGWKRCRTRSGTPSACRQIAVKGTVPPQCPRHGANPGSASRKAAANRRVEDQAMSRLEAIMREDAEAARLLDPAPVDDPFTALLELAAEIRALREILRDRVLQLKAGDWRYMGRQAEETRAEVILYERSLEREASILIQIVKLKPDERLLAIQERKLVIMERSLTLALQGSGLDLPAQDKAMAILRRELANASLN
jgi:hypothetical protein